MEQVAGKVKTVDLAGIRYQALKATAAYESSRTDLAEHARAWERARSTLSWLDHHADEETVRAVAMRLGIPPETLLEVLHEVEQVQSGQAAAEGSCIPEGSRQ